MSHIVSIGEHTPQIEAGVFLAPTATVSGDVRIARDVSVFYGVSVRGDSECIVVGEGTNLQDNVVLHADAGYPCTIGAGVSIGHTAVVHGATVGNDCLIGMSATVMNGAHLGEGSLVAAGALVLEDTEVPPRSLVAGVPAKVRRELSDEEIKHLRDNATVYLQHKEAHRVAHGQSGT